METTPGKLYIVSTPIGNLKDITLRALDVLKSVDRVVCEDTRRTAPMLHVYEVKKPLLSFHEHNEESRIPEIIRKLGEGEKIALVSDAGTPLISDPGYRLVREAIRQGIELEALPGPCAAINALVLSGLPPDRFLFVGFLSQKSATRVRQFQELKELPHTLIFYESTHRLQKFLQEAYQVLGPRPMSVHREMTKKFEEAFRGNLSESLPKLPLKSWKGEFVVLISGKT